MEKIKERTEVSQLSYITTLADLVLEDYVNKFYYWYSQRCHPGCAWCKERAASRYVWDSEGTTCQAYAAIRS